MVHENIEKLKPAAAKPADFLAARGDAASTLHSNPEPATAEEMDVSVGDVAPAPMPKANLASAVPEIASLSSGMLPTDVEAILASASNETENGYLPRR